MLDHWYSPSDHGSYSHCKVYKTIHYKRLERSNKKREEQSRDNRDKIENNLIQEYAAGRELRKALNVVLQGDMSNRPSEITISSRGIIAIYGNLINNKSVCYDFLENRVEPPAFVDRDSWYQPRPIMAMGWAVIRVLKNDYDIVQQRRDGFLKAEARQTFLIFQGGYTYV